MTLSEFVALLKREARIGTVADTSDRTTTDIIQFLNKRMFQVWRKWPWDWSAEDISITLVAGTSDYALSSTIGQISELYIGGQTGRLKYINRKHYLDWVRTSMDVNNTPMAYLKLGRDTSLNLKIRVTPTPNASATILGWGKKRISKLTVADIALATPIPFFPEEMHDILYQFVMADILSLMDKKPDSVQMLAIADANLLEMIESEEAQPDEDVDAPVPDAYRWKQRNRLLGTSVV